MPIYRYYDVPEEIFKLILDPKLRDSFLKKHTKNGYLFLPFRYEHVGDVYTKDGKNYTDAYYEVRKQERSENKRVFDYVHQDNNKKTTEEIAYSGYTGTAVYTVMNQIQALLELGRHDDAVKRAIRYFTKTGYNPYYPNSLEVAKVFKHAKFEMKAERKLSVEEVDKILREDYELERGGRFIEKESKDGMKTKKKRSHVNKSSGTVVTNPRPRSKRDRLSKEAKSKARWDEKEKQKRVNKLKDQLEQLRKNGYPNAYTVEGTL